MNSVTVQVDQLIGWATSGYLFLHVLFGLVTHYHSVWQVRKYNTAIAAPDSRATTKHLVERLERGGSASCRVSPFKMFVLFAGRMTMGLPWFGLRSIISPVGSQWHMTPQQISDWGSQ